MKRKIAVLFFLLAFINLYSAVPVKGIKIGKIGFNSLEIEFEIPDYQFRKVKTEQGEFIKIEGKHFGYIPDYGKAQLPTVSFSIMLNLPVKPEVKIVKVEKKELILDKKIYPVQKPWPKSRSVHSRPFTIDNSYYNSDISNNNLVSLSNIYRIRGKAGVTVTLHPFQYNPKKSRLTVYKKIKLVIKGAGINNSFDSQVFEKIYSSSFINYFSPDSLKTKAVNSGRILIITPSQYVDELNKFVSHKEEIGYIVDVYTLDDTGTTREDIKNFIQLRYNDISTRPDFVILVGDTNVIPSYYIGTVENNADFYTDLNFSLLDGNDYFPDVALGRFSVLNGEELSNLVNKIIFTETNIGNLKKDALFIAGYDSYYYETPISTHNYVSERFFIPGGFECEKLYRYTMGINTSQISSSINNGKIFVIYSGHGNPVEWYLDYGVEFRNSDVIALYNDIYPFVFSFACQTGQLEANESFGEAWIRYKNGASSFWGSTVYSYWDEDDVLEKSVFEARFNNGILQIGPMFNMGKISFYNYYSGQGVTERYFQQYNLFGDPSLYTGIFQPSSMAVFRVDRETIGCGESLNVELWDSDLTSPSITIEAINLVNGAKKDFVLTKTADGIYSGVFQPDDLCGLDGGIIELSYYDSNYGFEGQNIVTRWIYVDCQSPYIIHNRVLSVLDDSASCEIYFNEKLSGAVQVLDNNGVVKKTYELDNSSKLQIDMDSLTQGGDYKANFNLTDSAGNTNNQSGVYLFSVPFFNILFENSCDENNGEFTTYADSGSNNWVLTASPYANSNNVCWYGADSASILDESLQFGPVYVDGKTYLVFYHRFAFENNYDGCVVEASTDGINFKDLGVFILQNGYNGKIAESYGNPLAGQSAFTGLFLNNEIKTVIDLSYFSGKEIYIRFRIGCDNSESVDGGGWYIDDIKVESQGTDSNVSYLVNINSSTVVSVVTLVENKLNLTLFDADGRVIGSVLENLTANSSIHKNIADLFQGFDLSNPPFTLKCESSEKAGLFQMEDITDSTGNMRTWTEANYNNNKFTALVPHIAPEFDYWNTYVQVMAPKNNVDSVFLSYSPWYQLISFPLSGFPSLSSREFNVVKDIFNGILPGFEFGDAFLKAEENGQDISLCATESFRFIGGDNLAKLTLEQDFSKTLYVAHVDNSDYWWTGIAVVNPSAVDFATVNFTAFDENGNIVGTKKVYLNAGERYSFVTKDEFPQTSAWFKIDSDYPVVGYELFGTMNRRLLTGIDLISTPRLTVLLPVVDSSNDWFGITIVNPFEFSNQVVLEGYLNGQKVFEKTMNLYGYQKWVGLLTDLYNGGDVDMVKITSEKGVVSFCLEGDSNMTKVGGVKGFAPF